MITHLNYRIKDHSYRANGITTRHLCSQDADSASERRKASDPKIRNRDTPGMERWHCHGKLSVRTDRYSNKRTTTIHIEHHDNHPIHSCVDLSKAPLSEGTSVSPPQSLPAEYKRSTDSEDSDRSASGDDDGDAELPSENRARYEKEMRKWSSTLHEFADLVDYQVQFGEVRFLKEIERQMTRARGFIDDCLEHERLTNSARLEKPGT
jgi:hypothetical protein